MKNKRMRYISITAAILLVFVLLMLLFSNRSGDFSAMEAQDGVLDATSADFSSAVYEIDGEWTFYPEVLGSGAELDAAQPGRTRRIHSVRLISAENTRAAETIPDTRRLLIRLQHARAGKRQ